MSPTQLILFRSLFDFHWIPSFLLQITQVLSMNFAMDDEIQSLLDLNPPRLIYPSPSTLISPCPLTFYDKHCVDNLKRVVSVPSLAHDLSEVVDTRLSSLKESHLPPHGRLCTLSCGFVPSRNVTNVQTTLLALQRPSVREIACRVILGSS